ncbi:MAG: hypothetical protein ABIR36_03245 [Nitrospiraceae bacterium]
MVNPIGLTLTVSEPVLAPAVDAVPLTFSQAIFDEAVQVSVPVPALVIVTDWLTGATPF